MTNIDILKIEGQISEDFRSHLSRKDENLDPLNYKRESPICIKLLNPLKEPESSFAGKSLNVATIDEWRGRVVKIL